MTKEERLIAYSRLGKAMMITTAQFMRMWQLELPSKMEFTHESMRGSDWYSMRDLRGKEWSPSDQPKDLRSIYGHARATLGGIQGLGIMDKPQEWELDPHMADFDWEWAQQELRKYDKKFPQPTLFAKSCLVEYVIRREVELVSRTYRMSNSREELMSYRPSATEVRNLSFNVGYKRASELTPMVTPEEITVRPLR